MARRPEPFPQLVRPMLATPGSLPTGPADVGWAYEFKWDGVRAVTYVEGRGLRLLSRNDRDISATYPELRALAAALPGMDVVLDGELVAFDDRGSPSFAALQRRMHVTGAAAVHRLTTEVPVVYLVFDVLHLDGRSLLTERYDARRALLERLELHGSAWQVPECYVGGGEDILAASQRNGLEGVICKRLDSAYRPGARAETWRKVKNVRMQEVVVGGWKLGEGRRAGGLGSLLIGVPGPGGLEFVGHVGTGFSDSVLASLLAQLRQRDRRTSPFESVPAAQAKDAHWVSPTLVGEVAFTEWTKEGRLRHPSWRGLRSDKSPQEVVRGEG